VGRELEFPLVWPDGRAGDVRLLWPHLQREGQFKVKYDDAETKELIVALEGEEFVYEAEVGLGTIELLTPACDDLVKLEAAVGRGMRPLLAAAQSAGMVVLGFGIQPRTLRSPRIMTPKKRYGALLQAIGKPWLHFCTTAADQLHVDIARSELVPMLNWMNLMSGPLVALLANSSVYGGRSGRFVSGREGLLETVGKHRNGMTPRRFDTLVDFMAYIAAHPCYVLKQANGSLRQYNQPFDGYLAKQGADLYEYLWHEHYTWNSARARVEHSTIEIRPACQQPANESMAASALSLGFVEARAAIAEYVTRVLGDDPWPAMLRFRARAIRDGLRARQPARNFLRTLVGLAEEGLRGRQRREERYLQPVWDRLELRQTPGDRARDLFCRHGMPALVDYLVFE
jgi:gamma-glutamylcysteine synthetase